MKVGNADPDTRVDHGEKARRGQGCRMQTRGRSTSFGWRLTLLGITGLILGKQTAAESGDNHKFFCDIPKLLA